MIRKNSRTACIWLTIVALVGCASLFSPKEADGVIEQVYTLPFWDSYTLTCGFGCYSGHQGVDYDLGVSGVVGEHVAAAASGTAKPCPLDPDAGNYLVIDHGNGHRTRYLHLNTQPIPSDGTQVARGQVIGYEGSTGYTEPPGFVHLHFETRHGATTFTCGFDGTAVDPYSGSTYMWRTNPPSYPPTRNLLRNASFEKNTTSPWIGSNATGAIYDRSCASYASTVCAKGGRYFMELGALQAWGAAYQDIPIAPLLDESYSVTVWMRCSFQWPAACPAEGDLILFGVGNNDEDRTYFKLTSTTWVPVTVALDVKNTGHTSLRLQISLKDANRPINVDAIDLHRTMLKNSSFEKNTTSPWIGSNATGAIYDRSCASYASTVCAKSGRYFMELGASQPWGNAYHDVPIAPVFDESYSVTVWMRCSFQWPSACPAEGDLILFGVGNNDEDRTYFKLTSTTWVPVTVGLDVKNTGHTSLRLQISLKDANRPINVDGTDLHRTMLKNASFEKNTTSPWVGSNATGAIYDRSCASYVSTVCAKGGRYFMELGASQAWGAAYEDIPIAPAFDESYSVTVWMRCSFQWPAACPAEGDLILFGVGSNDEDRTYFKLTSTTWVPVTVGLDVKSSAHTSLRLQISLKDANRPINVDVARSP
jgi:hypothetical protein